MFFETYVRDSWGDFKSMGTASCDVGVMAAFFEAANEDGEVPRLCISSVTRDGILVTVTRAIALSGVETERNECLLSSDEEAQMFEMRLQKLRHENPS